MTSENAMNRHIAGHEIGSNDRKTKRVGPTALSIVGTLLLTISGFTPASAEPATVLVESLSIPVSGVAEMDYVAPGTTIELGAGGVIVLDHLASCTRETAIGGVLRVGADESETKGGKITLLQVECDGRMLQLSAAMAQGGGQVYRAIERTFSLHSTAPLIMTRQHGTVLIERLDKPDTPITLQATGGNPPTIDLAASHHELVAGGYYRITLASHSMTFRVDSAAKGRDAPLLARLLPI
jgi:hypothetical protein